MIRHTSMWTQRSECSHRPPAIQSYETDDLRVAVDYQDCRARTADKRERGRFDSQVTFDSVNRG